MKDRKVIRDPGAFQLLADETRLKMVYLLRAKEMTVSQIAGDLGLTPQTIYHHIRKLREADMVEVAKEERIDHLVESYYRATAGVFHFVNGACSQEGDETTRTEMALKAISKMGHELEVTRPFVAKVAKLRDEIRRRTEDPTVLDRVYELEGLDPFIQRDVIELIVMTEMDDDEFERCLDSLRKLRRLLIGKMRAKE
ncbi:MAG: winged helix-turn-helix transcriptional regulator [Methanobacteriota archaeon]|nr:MAG: winged helix-turn-helix transcriptional regulator [Euryarchaeota archaeon]